MSWMIDILKGPGVETKWCYACKVDLPISEEYQTRFPDKYRARYEFANAIKLGKITRGTHCQMCEIECLTHGHREDYSKPFDVIRLCVGCHGRKHRKVGDLIC